MIIPLPPCRYWPCPIREDLKIHVLLFGLFHSFWLRHSPINLPFKRILFPPFHQRIKIPTLMIDTEVWEWKLLGVHPLHRNKLRAPSTLYVLHKNINTMIVMDIPEFGVVKIGLSPVIILGVDEFTEGVKTMKLVKDIF